MPAFTLRTASHRRHSQDRVFVQSTERAWILGLADGAGGSSGGASAAEHFIEGVQRQAFRPTFAVTSPEAWSALLLELDDEIRQTQTAGETTGIVMAITETEIIGASCGDSEAWLFAADHRHQLTENQARRRRLGSGRAEPQSFRAIPGGTLVMASDGLFGQASLDDIASIVLADPCRAADALVQLLEHRHRGLPDDVAIVVAWLG